MYKNVYEKQIKKTRNTCVIIYNNWSQTVKSYACIDKCGLYKWLKFISSI